LTSPASAWDLRVVEKVLASTGLKPTFAPLTLSDRIFSNFWRSSIGVNCVERKLTAPGPLCAPLVDTPLHADRAGAATTPRPRPSSVRRLMVTSVMRVPFAETAPVPEV
jgi:hypothetical protein